MKQRQSDSNKNAALVADSKAPRRHQRDWRPTTKTKPKNADPQNATQATRQNSSNLQLRTSITQETRIDAATTQTTRDTKALPHCQLKPPAATRRRPLLRAATATLRHPLSPHATASHFHPPPTCRNPLPPTCRNQLQKPQRPPAATSFHSHPLPLPAATATRRHPLLISCNSQPLPPGAGCPPPAAANANSHRHPPLPAPTVTRQHQPPAPALAAASWNSLFDNWRHNVKHVLSCSPISRAARRARATREAYSAALRRCLSPLAYCCAPALREFLAVATRRPPRRSYT